MRRDWYGATSQSLTRLNLRVFAIVALLLAPLGAAAADSGLQSGDFRISTQETNYNLNNGDFVMPHSITASRPGTEITGDHAQGNARRKVIVISGNVVVHQSGPVTIGNPASQHAQEPSTLTADTISVDWGSRIYAATGKVHFVQGIRDVTADRGTLNDFSHHLNLNGNVHIVEGPQSMDADSVDYDTLSESVKAKGNVTIRTPAQQH